MSANRSVVEAVLGNHLQAFFRQSIEGVVEDYAEDSVLIVPDGALRGRAEIRRFFNAFVGGLAAGFLDSFKIRRHEIAVGRSWARTVLRPFALACFAPCSNSQYTYSFRAVYASPAVLHPAFLSTPFGS